MRWEGVHGAVSNAHLWLQLTQYWGKTKVWRLKEQLLVLYHAGTKGKVSCCRQSTTNVNSSALCPEYREMTSCPDQMLLYSAGAVLGPTVALLQILLAPPTSVNAYLRAYQSPPLTMRPPFFGCLRQVDCPPIGPESLPFLAWQKQCAVGSGLLANGKLEKRRCWAEESPPASLPRTSALCRSPGKCCVLSGCTCSVSSWLSGRSGHLWACTIWHNLTYFLDHFLLCLTNKLPSL